MDIYVGNTYIVPYNVLNDSMATHFWSHLFYFLINILSSVIFSPNVIENKHVYIQKLLTVD